MLNFAATLDIQVRSEGQRKIHFYSFFKSTNFLDKTQSPDLRICKIIRQPLINLEEKLVTLFKSALIGL